jgi:DNA-binding CsgD family transcriptional regulator
VIDETRKLDHLAGQLFQGVLMPEMLPEVIVSLAAWLQPTSLDELAPKDGAVAPGYCPLSRNGNPDHASCRRAGQIDDLVGSAEHPCAVCSMLDGNRPNWRRVIELFVHCRALRIFADHAASWAHTSHVAAIILTPQGRVLDCDYRGESFLKNSNVLHLTAGTLQCVGASDQSKFAAALKETTDSGRTANMLLYAPAQPEQRFSLTLSRMLQRPSVASDENSARVPDILCLVAPLDGRRIATARQLMDFFGLSAAEARLARAICHGDSVEEYATDQGLRLPTVRTQLSSIFHKTGAERQATLVRLIAGIPVVRDSA